jgi:site-specific DNA-methyltransferase (adenine-specific)
MTTVRLLMDDCVERLSRMGEGFVGGIVCDPPYGLEFMGKDWDAPWKYTLLGETGFKGKAYPPTPSFQSTRNPVCRKCHRMKRGSVRHEPCDCAEPDFDDLDQRLRDRLLYQTWCETWLRECHRVLVPGGVIKVFGGTRMHHRIGAAMEAVGFLDVGLEAWNYASGFPKSLDVGKAIDKLKGVERKVVGTKRGVRGADGTGHESAMPGKAVGVKQVAVDVPVTAPATPEAEAWDGWGTALKPAWEPVLVGRKPA